MKHQPGTLLSYTAGFVLAGTLLAFNPVLVGTASSGSSNAQHIKETVTAKVKADARQKSNSFNTDAVSAIKQVEQADSLLKDGKYEDALNSLKSADRKLEAAIAADPALKLIPVMQDVRTYDLMTSPKAVRDEVKSIREELEAENVQEARIRLDQLRSELITTYVYLPVEIYPSAIKEAVKQTEEKQYQQAEETIETAMNSLVEEVEAVPLPVALANDAILDAETKHATDSEQAQWDLDYAHEQLLTAERLGYFYGDKEAYKAALQHVETLRNAINGKSEVDKLFTDAKAGVKHLIDKFRTHHPMTHG